MEHQGKIDAGCTNAFLFPGRDHLTLLYFTLLSIYIKNNGALGFGGFTWVQESNLGMALLFSTSDGKH